MSILTTSTIHCPAPDCDWTMQVAEIPRRETLPLADLRRIVRQHADREHPRDARC